MSTLCEPIVQEEIEQSVSDSVWNFKYPMIAPEGLLSAREASQAERAARIQRAEAAGIEAARQSGLRQGEAQAPRCAYNQRGFIFHSRVSFAILLSIQITISRALSLASTPFEYFRRNVFQWSRVL